MIGALIRDLIKNDPRVIWTLADMPRGARVLRQQRRRAVEELKEDPDFEYAKWLISEIDKALAGDDE